MTLLHGEAQTPHELDGEVSVRIHATIVAVAVGCGFLFALPPQQAGAGHSGNTHAAQSLGKACDTQATEQKLSGDARDAFMAACRSHEATESQAEPVQTSTGQQPLGNEEQITAPPR